MFEEKAIIFSAPSGAGKTTIVRNLLENFSFLEFAISATTRKKRDCETDKKDYYFLSKEDFIRKIKANSFLEYEEVYEGDFYGTLKSEFERIWKNQKHVIVDLDVKGGIAIKKLLGKKALAVFVKPPSIDSLKERLLNRKTESSASLEKRVVKAKHELAFESEFDEIIINEDLSIAIEEAKRLIKSFVKPVEV